MLNRKNVFMLCGIVAILYALWFVFAPVHAATLYMGDQANMDGLSFLLRWCGLFLIGFGAVYQSIVTQAETLLVR